MALSKPFLSTLISNTSKRVDLDEISTPVEEHYLLDRSLDEVSFALQLLES